MKKAVWWALVASAVALPAARAAVASGPEMVLQIGHQRAAVNASIVAVAFSPDGRWVASAGGPFSQSGEVKIWSAQSGALWRTLPAVAGDGSDMSQVVFSPDSRSVAAVGDGGIWLWRVSDGARLRSWGPREVPPASLAISPGGGTLFSAGIGRSEARDWRSNRLLWSLPDTSFTQIALSPDGKLLAASDFDAAEGVEVLDAGTGQRLRLLEPEKRDVNDTVWSLAFSPDGALVASASGAGLRVWEASTGRLLQSWKGNRGEWPKLAFWPDGRLVSAGSDGLLRWWQPRTGRLSRTVKWPHKHVLALAPSRDGRRLAVVDFDNLRLWDGALSGARGERGGIAWHAPRGVWPSGGAAWSPRGVLAVPAQDATLRLWDAGAGRLSRTLREAEGIHGSAAFSPDGRLLANAGFDFLSVWDVASGRRLHALRGGDASFAPAWSPDGALIALDTGGNPGPIDVWDARGGKRLCTHEGTGPVGFSADGRTIVSGGWAFSSWQQVEFWDARTGKLRRALPQVPPRPRRAPGPLPRGAHLLAVAPAARALLCWLPPLSLPTRAEEPQVGTLQIWNGDGSVRHTLGEAPRPWRAAFSPDGRLLAVAGDKEVRVWDVAAGQRRAAMPVVASLSGLAFSPDGRLLACASEEGTVTLRRVRDGALAATLMILPARNVLDFECGYGSSDWIAWTPAGFYSASPGARDFIRWRVGASLLPAGRFEARFHRPDLMRQALARF